MRPSLLGKARSCFAVLFAYVIAMLVFFRVPILSGFDLGFGERGDGIIEISILEHWRNVLAGASPWHTGFYFYPYTGTLGYNDGYALYGLVYAFWRLFADPFHADTLNILTFKTIGFIFAYLLVARTLRWGRSAAWLVALLWTVASNISLQAVHAQLQSVALLPVAMMLAITAVRAERDGCRSKARWHAVALAALMAAWLMTSYYMAWFTIFSACLLTLCWLVLTGHWRPATLLDLLRRHGATLACGFGAFAVLILPFLATYLPKIRETGGKSYEEMLGYLVTPLIDMINVGPDNYLWGWIFRPLFALVHAVLPDDPALPRRVLGFEHEAGLPLITCVLVVTAAWRIIVRRCATEGDGATAGAASVELRAFAWAMMIAWALTLQFWIASPWGLVFEFVPGAKGLRVVSRYQLWLVLPFLLLAVAAWRDRATWLARSRPGLAAILLLLLVVENLGSETAAQLDRTDNRAALWGIPRPPAGCTNFYVAASRRGEPLYLNRYMNDRYPHNVDAMLLAERWRVPTINGFSTFNPPDWNFGEPWAADYDERVFAYARRHHLHGLCRLDVHRADPWSRIPDRLP